MATNEQIKLDITSQFDPGGFAKANRAVKDLSGEVKKGSKVASSLFSAFGSLDGQVGAVVSSFSLLSSALKGGGVWALAGAGLAMLITKFVEVKSAASKFADEQRKLWRDELIKRQEKNLDALKSKYAEITEEIERGAKAAEKIAKAYEGLGKSEVAASGSETDRIVALLEGQRQTELSGIEDPVKRKAKELDYERQIFEAKKENAKFDRDQKAWAANEKVSGAERSLSEDRARLAALKARAEELKGYIESTDTQSEFNQKNPMPKDPSSGALKGQMIMGGIGGPLGIAAWEVKSHIDQKNYEEKMDAWIKEAGEFAKEQARLKKEAADELSKVLSGISELGPSIASKQIGISEARNERDNVVKANEAAATREAIAQNAINDKLKEFEKAQQEYQDKLDKSVKVAQQIARQEEKIAEKKQKQQDIEEKRDRWNVRAQDAKKLGAGGWNQQQQIIKKEKDDVDKNTRDEAKWVINAKKRMSTGAKLSEKEMNRIQNFQDWKKLQGQNPFAGPFDPGRAAAAQLAKMDANLNELKTLNTNIMNALKVN